MSPCVVEDKGWGVSEARLRPAMNVFQSTSCRGVERRGAGKRRRGLLIYILGKASRCVSLHSSVFTASWRQYAEGWRLLAVGLAAARYQHVSLRCRSNPSLSVLKLCSRVYHEPSSLRSKPPPYTMSASLSSKAPGSCLGGMGRWAPSCLVLEGNKVMQ